MRKPLHDNFPRNLSTVAFSLQLDFPPTPIIIMCGVLFTVCVRHVDLAYHVRVRIPSHVFLRSFGFKDKHADSLAIQKNERGADMRVLRHVFELAARF